MGIGLALVLLINAGNIGIKHQLSARPNEVQRALTISLMNLICGLSVLALGWALGYVSNLSFLANPIFWVVVVLEGILVTLDVRNFKLNQDRSQNVSLCYVSSLALVPLVGMGFEQMGWFDDALKIPESTPLALALWLAANFFLALAFGVKKFKEGQLNAPASIVGFVVISALNSIVGWKLVQTSDSAIGLLGSIWICVAFIMLVRTCLLLSMTDGLHPKHPNTRPHSDETESLWHSLKQAFIEIQDIRLFIATTLCIVGVGVTYLANRLVTAEFMAIAKRLTEIGVAASYSKVSRKSELNLTRADKIMLIALALVNGIFLFGA